MPGWLRLTGRFQMSKENRLTHKDESCDGALFLGDFWSPLFEAASQNNYCHMISSSYSHPLSASH